MTPSRPEFVYFDLGNVLLHFDHGLAFRSMARIAGVPPELIGRVVLDSDLQTRYETGLISGEEFVAEIAEQLGRPLDTPEMLRAAADMFIPNHLILPALEHLQSLGIPIGLLSNTCAAHWEWIVAQRYPQVVDRFHPVILSFEVQRMKPDLEIYQIAAEAAGRRPEEIYFTDDREENVTGARNAGWQAEPFTSADRLMDTIKTW